MDGRGRLTQSLTWLTPWRALLPGTAISPAVRVRMRAQRARLWSVVPPTRVGRFFRRVLRPVIKTQVPRGLGVGATVIVLFASLGYGVVRGDHIDAMTEIFKDLRDSAGNAAGFRIVSLALTGERHMSREDVLASAGVTPHTSLLFLDVEAARERLKTNPWVADASILKLYPGELQISVTEREPFALWQKDGHGVVIAEDGTVLESFITKRLSTLPLVVGRGAETRAKDFLALVDRYPEIRDQLRASILIGERRWNLRLKNGLDVRLPEEGVGPALERLVTLDREVKLTSRDIAAIDLRLPDRVTVRLSPAAAAARLDALNKKPAKKGDRA